MSKYEVLKQVTSSFNEFIYNEARSKKNDETYSWFIRVFEKLTINNNHFCKLLKYASTKHMVVK